MDQTNPSRTQSAAKDARGRERQRTKPNTITRFLGEVDRPFLLIVILLVCVGSVAVFSSSYAYAAHRYHDSYALARPQLMYALLGITAMSAIAIAGPLVLGILNKFALLVYLVALAMNAVTPILGENYNGATRWLQIGPIQFQPSEFLKFALVLICVQHIVRNRDRLHTFRYGLLPFGFYGGLAVATTLMQKHLSASIIICLIIYIMMWVGGIGAKLLGTVAVGVGALAVSVLTFGRSLIEAVVPHALVRLQIWEDPFSYMTYETGGKGWQPAQSLYAISSGGFWGLGLGQSNQKHGYLPEPYNDYIFAILCEEMGFFGVLLVIGLFAALAWRGFYIATHSQDQFSSLLVMGIIAHVIIQVALNLAVVTNSIPSTGISLPFFSYGGTSLIILLCEMGLVLAVSRYSYTEKG